MGKKLLSVPLLILYGLIRIPRFWTNYGNIFPTMVTFATWASAGFFCSTQGGFTPLVWIALCLAIVSTGLNNLKAWLGDNKGMVYNDSGGIPVGWNGTLLTIHQIVVLAGIGLFIASIVLAGKAGVLASETGTYEGFAKDLSLPFSLMPL